MPPGQPAKPSLEGHSSQSADQPAAPKITINDLGDKTKPTTAPAETPAQPLTREGATKNFSEINEKHNVDPMRSTEIAKEPYKVPETPSGRTQTLRTDREETSKTGFAGQKTYTDASGQERRGVETYDKGSGQRRFFAENKDGGYTPHHVQDGGKTLQPLDNNGKPCGEPLRMQGHQENNRPGEGRPAEYRPEPRSFEQRQTERHNEFRQSDPRQTEPRQGEPRQPEFRQGEPRQFEPRQHESGQSEPRHFEPRQPEFRQGEPRQFEPRQHEPGQGEPRHFESRQPDSRQADFRPNEPHSQGDHHRNEFRPTDQTPRTPHELAQGRPDYSPGKDQHQDFSQTLRGGIERFQAADAAQLGVARQSIDPQNAARDILRSMDAGRGAQFEQAKFTHDLHGKESSMTRSADVNTNLKQFLDGNRTDLQGHLAHNLTRLNGEVLSNTYRSLSAQYGDFTAKIQTRIGAEGDIRGIQNRPMDVDLKSRDLSNAGRTILTSAEGLGAGRQIASLLDFLSRRDLTLDRVPGAEQSRMMIREALRMPNLDVTNNVSASLLVQRFFNQRVIEAGTQSLAMTLRPQQLETMREILDRVREQNLLTANGKLPEISRLLELGKMQELGKLQDLGKGLEPGRNLGLRAEQTLTGKILDASNATTRLEQNKSLTDASDARTARLQQQQQLNPQDKIAEIKTDGGKQKGEESDHSGKVSTGNNKEDNKLTPHEKDGKAKGPKDTPLNADEMALLLANKLKTLKDKEAEAKEKQKEKTQDQDKKDPKQKSRVKYKVKEGDTLFALAKNFLSNGELAAAIFHINRTVIPITTYNDKSYAAPPIDSVIWIPSDDDIDSYKQSGASKKYEKISFEGVEYASAEDELTARFGRRWFSTVEEPKSGKDAESSKENTRRANIERVLGNLKSADKDASSPASEAPTRRTFGGNVDRDTRRANIEKVLGSFAPEPPKQERTLYTARLGETLKSIALKHPQLQNVEAWKLLASVNGLTTETNERGSPLAILKRGMILKMPLKAELDAFRECGALPGDQSADSVELDTESNECGAEPVDSDARSIESDSEETANNPESGAHPEGIETTDGTQTESTSGTENALLAESEMIARNALMAMYQSANSTKNAEFKKAITIARDTNPGPTSFRSWRDQVTHNSIAKLEAFFSNQDQGSRELLLNKRSKNVPAARLVAQGSNLDINSGYRLSLEIDKGNGWEQVVEYDMSSTGSTHKTYDGTSRRSRPVNLSCTDILEVAQKDLATNWKNYVDLLQD